MAYGPAIDYIGMMMIVLPMGLPTYKVFYSYFNQE